MFEVGLLFKEISLIGELSLYKIFKSRSRFLVSYLIFRYNEYMMTLKLKHTSKNCSNMFVRKVFNIIYFLSSIWPFFLYQIWSCQFYLSILKISDRFFFILGEIILVQGPNIFDRKLATNWKFNDGFLKFRKINGSFGIKHIFWLC